MQSNNSSESDSLQKIVSSGQFINSRETLNSLPAYEISLLIESSPPNTRALIWQLIDEKNEGEILKNLSDDVREMILSFMDPAEVAEVTKDLEPDEVADILQDLPKKVMKEVLEKISDQNKSILEQVLKFPEDSAGGLMNTDVIVVGPYHSIELLSLIHI